MEFSAAFFDGSPYFFAANPESALSTVCITYTVYDSELRCSYTQIVVIVVKSDHIVSFIHHSPMC